MVPPSTTVILPKSSFCIASAAAVGVPLIAPAAFDTSELLLVIPNAVTVAPAVPAVLLVNVRVVFVSVAVTSKALVRLLFFFSSPITAALKSTALSL